MSAKSPPAGEQEDYPFPLTDVDRWVLSQTDEEFHYHSWDELKQIIADNNLSILKRCPSDLRRYLSWTTATKSEYGSMSHFICQKRLKWETLSSSTPKTGPLFDYQNPTPFADHSDFKILPNDWPYGLEPGIVHIVVWLKTRIPTEPPDGHLTAEGREAVERFVRNVFGERVAREDGSRVEAVMGQKVVWFKNWTALQSVPGLEHVHVLVRDVSEELIKSWTGGVRPLQDEVKRTEN